jgi:predicted HicB family RNase H-like nuclease
MKAKAKARARAPKAPPPAPMFRVMHIRVGERDHARLCARAHSSRITLAGLIRQILARYVLGVRKL